MITWLYRVALFVLLLGVSSLSYGGNQGSALLNAVTNGVAFVGIPAMVLFYFTYPTPYKVASWLLLLGVILLLLEAKYNYGNSVYSPFVIKRFFYCGLATVAYYLASKAGTFKIKYVVYLIFALYFLNQIVLGHIFSYALTSETRTTAAPEAFYLVIPFLYYIVIYLKEQRLIGLLGALFTFGLIVFLLHRSVISSAVIAAAFVFGLSALGRIPTAKLQVGRTLGTLFFLLIVATPLAGALSGNKAQAFMENIGGIFSPKDDETGSWRYEQSQYYMGQFPERPLLGWRYDGYDRGEIMDNEDFPDKGTIIHSQYTDMLYNYGAVGMGINLLIILSTLATIYFRNKSLNTEQLVLFGFIASGLIYGISYQLPVYYWGFVGLGMFCGMARQLGRLVVTPLTTIPLQDDVPPQFVQPHTHSANV